MSIELYQPLQAAKKTKIGINNIIIIAKNHLISFFTKAIMINISDMGKQIAKALKASPTALNPIE